MLEYKWSKFMDIIKVTDSNLYFSQFGADVNRADHWGVTPMYLAATNAQLDVIRNLILAGAELSYKNKVQLQK